MAGAAGRAGHLPGRSQAVGALAIRKFPAETVELAGMSRERLPTRCNGGERPERARKTDPADLLPRPAPLRQRCRGDAAPSRRPTSLMGPQPPQLPHMAPSAPAPAAGGVASATRWNAPHLLGGGGDGGEGHGRGRGSRTAQARARGVRPCVMARVTMRAAGPVPGGWLGPARKARPATGTADPDSGTRTRTSPGAGRRVWPRRDRPRPRALDPFGTGDRPSESVPVDRALNSAPLGLGLSSAGFALTSSWRPPCVCVGASIAAQGPAPTVAAPAPGAAGPHDGDGGGRSGWERPRAPS